MPREFVDEIEREGFASIERLDALAKQGPRDIPNELVAGMALSIAHIVCKIPDDFADRAKTTQFLGTMMKNIYRAGYYHGRQSLEIMPNAPQG